MEVRKHLSTKDLMNAFGVSHMSIHAWRKGSPTREPLPVIDTGTRTVAFKPAPVKQWAKRNGIVIVDASALDREPVIAAKPGPKTGKRSSIKAHKSR